MKSLLFLLALISVYSKAGFGRASGFALVPGAERFSVPELLEREGMKPTSRPENLEPVMDRSALLVFGYTSCMGVCPNTMKSLEKLFKRKEIQKNIRRVLFVSIDPKVDTAQTVKSFLSRFKLNTVGYYGDSKHTANVYSKFVTGRASVLFSPAQHSSLVYFVGRDGNLKGTVSTEIPLHQMARAIDSLVQAE